MADLKFTQSPRVTPPTSFKPTTTGGGRISVVGNPLTVTPTPPTPPGGGPGYIYDPNQGQAPGDAITTNGGADKILSP